MGLPVGFDFCFGIFPHTKARPPYSQDKLATVKYRNTDMPEGAPRSLGGVMLRLEIEDAHTTVSLASATVDTSLPDEARAVDWGDGATVTGLVSTGFLDPEDPDSEFVTISHEYVREGVYYVRFTDCITELSICGDDGVDGDAIKDALRQVSMPMKVMRLDYGCLMSGHMDQDVVVLPGVTDVGTSAFGSMGSALNTVRVLSLPRVTSVDYMGFSSGPSLEVLCMDRLASEVGNIWAFCPRLKWILIRGKTCEELQEGQRWLVRNAPNDGGLVGANGFIQHGALYLDS